jgi:hypothetical protein
MLWESCLLPELKRGRVRFAQSRRQAYELHRGFANRAFGSGPLYMHDHGSWLRFVTHSGPQSHVSCCSTRYDFTQSIPKLKGLRGVNLTQRVCMVSLYIYPQPNNVSTLKISLAELSLQFYFGKKHTIKLWQKLESRIPLLRLLPYRITCLTPMLFWETILPSGGMAEHQITQILGRFMNKVGTSTFKSFCLRLLVTLRCLQ